jgi:hypothetical protein
MIIRSKSSFPGVVVGLDPDAVTLIAAMTTAPGAARQQLISDHIVQLKTDGVWALLDTYYVMAAHDEQASRLNWKSPGNFTLTPNGTITFTADRGWQGDGSTGYLDTGWAPATHGVNYALNDASLGLYSRSDTFGLYIDMGSGHGTNANRAYVGLRINSDAIIRINQGPSGNGVVGVATSTGLQVSRRTASNATQIVRDGVVIFSDTRLSDGLSIYKFYIAAENRTDIASNYTNRQYTCAFTGAAMTTTQQADFYTEVQTGWMTPVGAAV